MYRSPCWSCSLKIQILKNDFSIPNLLREAYKQQSVELRYSLTVLIETPRSKLSGKTSKKPNNLKKDHSVKISTAVTSVTNVVRFKHDRVN